MPIPCGHALLSSSQQLGVGPGLVGPLLLVRRGRQPVADHLDVAVGGHDREGACGGGGFALSLVSFADSGSDGFTYDQYGRSSYSGQSGSGDDLSTLTASGGGNYAATGQGSFAPGFAVAVELHAQRRLVGRLQLAGLRRGGDGRLLPLRRVGRERLGLRGRELRPRLLDGQPDLDGAGLGLRRLHRHDRDGRDGGGLGGGRVGVGRGQRHDGRDGFGHVGGERRDGLGLVHLDGQFDPAGATTPSRSRPARARP